MGCVGPLFALEDLEVHQHRNCFFPYAAYHYGSDTLFFTAKKGDVPACGHVVCLALYRKWFYGRSSRFAPPNGIS